MIQRLYQNMLRLSASPRAPIWLAATSFAEASFFPIPPDVLLIPMVLARPTRAWALAALCTLASVLGGCFGYFIGAELLERVAMPLLRLYHYQGAFAAFTARYAQWGLWVILIKGFTPIPFKIVTIASGAARFNFPVFVAASLVTRAARFFLVAGLLRAFGDSARVFIEQRLTLITTLFIITLMAGFLALRYL